MVKITDPAVDMGFDSQHLHSGSEPSIIPVTEDLALSSGLLGHQAHMWYIYIHTGKHPYT